MRTKIVLLLTTLFLTYSSFAQGDKIYLHNGKNIDGTVIEIGNFTIAYSYAGEKAKQIISKYAVDKVIYGGSNREEKITSRVVVNSESDWQNVVILDDKTEITGLVKIDNVESSGGGKFVGAKAAQEKCLERIKKAAALLKCPFVYLSENRARSLFRVVIQN